eukprot:58123-Chlamydomonas_euryale.AAC.1
MERPSLNMHSCCIRVAWHCPDFHRLICSQPSPPSIHVHVYAMLLAPVHFRRIDRKVRCALKAVSVAPPN